MTLKSSSVSEGCAQFKIGFLVITGAFGISGCVWKLFCYWVNWCNIHMICWHRAMGGAIVCGYIENADE